MGLSRNLTRTFSHYENCICDIYDYTIKELKDAIQSGEYSEPVGLLLVALYDIGEIELEDIKMYTGLSKLKIEKWMEDIYDRKDRSLRTKLKYIHQNRKLKFKSYF